ncbi:ribonuclease HII [Candidatus Liberibacter americanus]|uniref:Ribonuclease HII n=1 Tax=Candidatus Liberibacter americanus str. Sao Paulo TaxID=1261131 RepID=U6B451_9HYPH|nr:ribonuclease HII [Candidatus Liberibacter americanus]AHA27839.1 Ribonuclease HII [Candidatus Liberibacter americanus str. Sao Paulo]EMS36007.1 ribonuclease HII [Candidatus Liberibacter americanus PW_SP]
MIKGNHPNFEFELKLHQKNLWPIAGIDEVGRGALAGPIVVAAVILNPDKIPLGINDSKMLTQKKREKIYEEIIDSSIISIDYADNIYIDNNNIHKATLDIMCTAVKKLYILPKSVLIDGRSVPKNLPCQSFAIVKGDKISLSIAAASIVAKVTRDRIMREAHKIYPKYGFDSHVGYPTAKHLQAIKENGPSTIHRMSFRPLKYFNL